MLCQVVIPYKDLEYIIKCEFLHLEKKMKKVNKQCLLDTPRIVRFSEKTWQVIVKTSRPKF